MFTAIKDHHLLCKYSPSIEEYISVHYSLTTDHNNFKVKIILSLVSGCGDVTKIAVSIYNCMNSDNESRYVLNLAVK